MNLIEQAVKIKKPTKTDAQQIIKRIAEQCPEQIQDLAALYVYFMPATPKKPKTDFQWVAQAAGKKDVRYYLNYVYVDEKNIVATDGHRLHMIPNSDNIEPGYYLPNGDKAHGPDFAKYPDYEQVKPATGEIKEYNIDSLGIKEGGGIIAYNLGDNYYQKLYLDQALTGCGVFKAFGGIMKRGSMTALQIDNGIRTAILMPVRM